MVLASRIWFAAAAAAKAAKSAGEKAAASSSFAPSSSLPKTGLMRPGPVSPALQKFLGKSESSRTETIKLLWAYIKSHNLQDPAARKFIICDDALKQLFDKERFSFLEVPGLVNRHFPKKGQS
ncbi:hypothetical protein R1sor_021290 [Riccia sorocarpa]|uniref:DM2 domain-containing protein n=1 Tax=Riccia sorocarpa TaxID=122646 RepID=A0ABD3GMD4_9MARC